MQTQIKIKKKMTKNKTTKKKKYLTLTPKKKEDIIYSPFYSPFYKEKKKLILLWLVTFLKF